MLLGHYSVSLFSHHEATRCTVNSLYNGHHRDRQQLSVLERCLVYREFRYSKMTEKWHAGTSCPSKYYLYTVEVAVKRVDCIAIILPGWVITRYSMPQQISQYPLYPGWREALRE